MLDKTEAINQLLDRYEEILTEKQREIMSMYYRDDLSLREIAEELSISHSAVFDAIKRTEKTLLNIEEKIKYNQLNQALRRMISELKSLNLSNVNDIIDTFEQKIGGNEDE